VPHPFKPWTNEVESKKSDNEAVVKGDKSTDSATEKPAAEETKYPEIKLDEIRIIKSDLPSGKYVDVCPIAENKLMLQIIEETSNDKGKNKNTASLSVADLNTNQITNLATSVDLFEVSENQEWMIIHSSGRLRVGRAGEQFDDNDKSYKEGGWISLSSALLSINPREEWENILSECWWLCRENFWRKKEGDWDQVLEKYRSILPGIRSREDLNFLLEELIGELATSHNYILNRGENDIIRHQPQGFLGGKVSWAENGYRLVEVDTTKDASGFYLSPLLEQGVDLKENDVITSIDGQKCSKNVPISKLLRNKGGKSVRIGYLRNGETKNTTITLLGGLKYIAYNKWVNKNREYVHKKSSNRIGYLHIPDMVQRGFAEFHKGYNLERYKQGLIIDVRYNSGGHVSPIIISALQRKQTSIAVFGDQIETEPAYSNQGNLIMICNQHSGSDGDMVVHSFKSNNLGKVVGKRTWGGLIGISPKRDFLDGGLSSQAEYALWFQDVGLGIENHGMDPDIEVEENTNRNSDLDPQLDKGIELLLEQLPNKSISEEIIDKFGIFGQ
jgi:tricorn protease